MGKNTEIQNGGNAGHVGEHVAVKVLIENVIKMLRNVKAGNEFKTQLLTHLTISR